MHINDYSIDNPGSVFSNFMNKAMNLAMQGIGYTRPNPLVGCVLVHNNKIISSGYHRSFGSKHAERTCLENIDPPPESVLFVNLEPCCHHGKTPPCTDIIIKKNIKRVIIANTDTNPLVNGKGISCLLEHGVEVIHGISAERGKYINRHYFYHQKHHVPFTTLKLGSTLDGKIADKNLRSQWITNERSRIKAHWLRAINQAVLVGINTFIHDKSRLDTRFPYKNMPSPFRVFIDRNFRLEEYISELSDDRPTFIYSYCNGPSNLPGNINFIRVTPNVDIILHSLRDLGRRGINSLLLEGGGEMAFAFLKRSLVQELHITYSPRILGGKKSISSFEGEGFLLNSSIKIKKYKIYRFNEDFEFEGYLD